MAKQESNLSFSGTFSVELSEAGKEFSYLYDGFLRSGRIVCNRVVILAVQNRIKLCVDKKEFIVPTNEISIIKTGKSGAGYTIWKHP